MENFEKTLDELLIRNNVNLEDGFEFYAEGGHPGFISYGTVVESIKNFDDNKKKKFLERYKKLEKEDEMIIALLDLVAQTLI